jgi:hypothetical protein
MTGVGAVDTRGVATDCGDVWATLALGAGSILGGEDSTAVGVLDGSGLIDAVGASGFSTRFGGDLKRYQAVPPRANRAQTSEEKRRSLDLFIF